MCSHSWAIHTWYCISCSVIFLALEHDAHTLCCYLSFFACSFLQLVSLSISVTCSNVLKCSRHRFTDALKTDMWWPNLTICGQWIDFLKPVDVIHLLHHHQEINIFEDTCVRLVCIHIWMSIVNTLQNALHFVWSFTVLIPIHNANMFVIVFMYLSIGIDVCVYWQTLVNIFSSVRRNAECDLLSVGSTLWARTPVQVSCLLHQCRSTL